jgi:hypothetical protein
LTIIGVLIVTGTKGSSLPSSILLWTHLPTKNPMNQHMIPKPRILHTMSVAIFPVNSVMMNGLLLTPDLNERMSHISLLKIPPKLTVMIENVFRWYGYEGFSPVYSLPFRVEDITRSDIEQWKYLIVDQEQGIPAALQSPAVERRSIERGVVPGTALGKPGIVVEPCSCCCCSLCRACCCWTCGSGSW